MAAQGGATFRVRNRQALAPARAGWRGRLREGDGGGKVSWMDYCMQPCATCDQSDDEGTDNEYWEYQMG